MLKVRQYSRCVQPEAHTGDFPTDPAYAAHNPSPGIVVKPHSCHLLGGLAARNPIVDASAAQILSNTVLDVLQEAFFDMI